MSATHREGPGDLPNVDELFPELYAELRRIARAHRRRLNRGDTLSTTAVVNEAYVRLKQAGQLAPRDRAHFLAVAARTMRFVLVDYARRAHADKRGTPAAVTDIEALAQAAAHAETTLALHDALDRLAAVHDRMARVVECRFFGGMTEDEIGRALGVSERTVRGDWQRAKLWLARDLGGGVSTDSGH